MTQVVDPENGLTFVELSHPWGVYTPIHPGYEEIKLERITHHAKQGVMTHKIVTIFHTYDPCECADAPGPGGAGGRQRCRRSFFGGGAVLSIPKGKWELIEPEDLEKANGRRSNPATSC